MPKRSPPLGSGLIARKGEAAPAGEAKHAGSPTSAGSKLTETIAVTVRLDHETYVRMKVHGARNRRTNQDILVEALHRYLKEHDAR